MDLVKLGRAKHWILQMSIQVHAHWSGSQCTKRPKIYFKIVVIWLILRLWQVWHCHKIHHKILPKMFSSNWVWVVSGLRWGVQCLGVCFATESDGERCKADEWVRDARTDRKLAQQNAQWRALHFKGMITWTLLIYNFKLDLYILTTLELLTDFSCTNFAVSYSDALDRLRVHLNTILFFSWTWGLLAIVLHKCEEHLKVNSASYSQWDGKWATRYELRGKGLVWLIWVVVCLVVANCGPIVWWRGQWMAA